MMYNKFRWLKNQSNVKPPKIKSSPWIKLTAVVLVAITGVFTARTTIAEPVYARGGYLEQISKFHQAGMRHRKRDLTVASFNLHNLYHVKEVTKNLDHPKKRRRPSYFPASEKEYNDKVKALATTIVTALNTPDIIAVQEVENYKRTWRRHEKSVLYDLVREIKAQSALNGEAVDYQFLYNPGFSDRRGISQAFLYRKDRVRLCPACKSDPLLGKRPHDKRLNRYVINPKSMNDVAQKEVLADNQGRQIMTRHVLVGKFKFFPNGTQAKNDSKTLYILNNHLKSNPSLYIDRRKGQAAFNAKLVQDLLRSAPGAHVLIAGDMNADFNTKDHREQLDPLSCMSKDREKGEAQLQNLTAKINDGRYSYLYRGKYQLLDWMFASPNMASRLVDVQIPHVNSKVSDLDLRSSDHDPILARFRFDD